MGRLSDDEVFESDFIVKHWRDGLDILQHHCQLRDGPVGGWLSGGKFESPIEAIFAAYWQILRIGSGGRAGRAIQLEAQANITVGEDRYRADFTVVPSDPIIRAIGDSFGHQMMVAIELDGHEFHERTKDQVAYRNKRDRVMQEHGWKVLHVSGSELVRTHIDCVGEVFLACCKDYEKLRAAIAKDLGVAI